MSALAQRLAEFAARVGSLAGAGPGDARAFCDGLLRAFGWPDLHHAGGLFEPPNRLLLGSTLLLELHPRGTDLARHRAPLFEHWQYHTAHPRYVALCEFTGIELHEFAVQLHEPVDRLAVADLPRDHAALTFLLPEPQPPRFRNDRVAVTRDAAARITAVFDRLVARGVDRDRARRCSLRIVHALFAADLGLAPRASPGSPRLDDTALEPLSADERDLLAHAAAADWSRVQLPVFGALFQAGMDPGRRHAQGAHFTGEADIQRLVLPTLVRPWRERIAAADSPAAWLALHAELTALRVLDPACGSGDILHVAYRELLRLEAELLARLHAELGPVPLPARVSLANLAGIDRDPFAIELARTTLRLADAYARRELGLSLETSDSRDPGLSFETSDSRDPGLFLETSPHRHVLSSETCPRRHAIDLSRETSARPDLRIADALFTDWPVASVILGNPPFQAKNKMQRAFGPEYLRRLRAAYPQVSGRADYCVYWFRRAHDLLPPGGRAGLVGTNTIRQNESRDGGLGHIVATGSITEAVAAEVWSGDAAVNVSIVNWVKQPDVPGPKYLSWQTGDAAHSPWQTVVVDRIGPALSPDTDVSAATPLRANLVAGCYQGQTVGHDGFLLAPAEARHMLAGAPGDAAVLFPYLGGDDLLGRKDGGPGRCVIDFGERDLPAAQAFAAPFARIAAAVLPDRRRAAADELRRNAEVAQGHPRARVNRHHAGFLDRWWQLSWRRGEMLAAIAPLTRFIACVRVTRRPIFEFVSPQIRPSDALVVFARDDDYSFGVLQSALHWQWFAARGSTLKRDFRYTSSTVWGAFPWPQAPSAAQVRQIAASARQLRTIRAAALQQHGLSRRQLYRTLDRPDRAPLRDAHEALDAAVRAAYDLRGDPLAFLLELNRDLAALEASGAAIVGPGLDALSPSPELRAACTSSDCIEPA